MTRALFVLFLIHLAQADVQVNSLFQSGRAEAESFAMSNKEQIRALHSKTQSHYLDLLSVLTGGKALPGTIEYLVEAIKNHSAAVKTKLTEEHTIQSGDLDAKFKDISTCDDNFTDEIGVVDDSGPTSPKSLAAAAKASLCECRNEEAKTVAESKGCADQLACLNTVMTNKLASKTSFLVDPAGNSQDMYLECPNGADDMCDNSGDWRNAAGATNDGKALAWFASQKTEWDGHWDCKTSTLQSLITAYNTAKSKHDELKDHNVTGCDAFDSNKDAQASTCNTLQSRATMNQCYYHAQKKNKCDTYTVCRGDAETAWTSSQTRETTDSQDRKDAWVAASKIECIIGTITKDTNGSLQIDSSITCDDIVCDSACTAALDLSESLARTPSARLGCTLAKEPCKTVEGCMLPEGCGEASDGWYPTCSAEVTASWGVYTPTYLIGTRTPPTCDGTPVAVSLSEFHSAGSCEPCSGLPEWQASGFTGFTPPPTLAP